MTKHKNAIQLVPIYALQVTDGLKCKYLFGVGRRLEAWHKLEQVLRRMDLEVLNQWNEDIVHLATAVLQLQEI